MKITDNEVLKELKRCRSYELSEDIKTYPDDERDGRSDIQFLADEVSYILSNYQEDGHVLCDDLERSQEILRKTHYGKTIPLYISTLKPIYRQSDIQSAKDCVNEYKRLKSLMKRLNDKGYRGQWL